MPSQRIGEAMTAWKRRRRWVRPRGIATRTTVAVCAAAVLVLAGCSEDAGSSEPPQGPATTTDSPRPTEPSVTEPAWTGEYTDDELQAYDAALRRWERYEQSSEPIWSRGRATAEAKALFSEYFYSPTDKFMFARLRSYEAASVKILGVATVLTSRPTRVMLRPDGGAVTIKQCIDPASVTVSERGETVSGGVEHPFVRTVMMSQLKDGPFLVGSVDDASTGKVRKCNG